MPTIDITKLRRFRADAQSCHAAMQRASEAMRFAREDLSRARNALEEVRNPLPGVKRADAKAEAPLLRALKDAEGTFSRAQSEHDRLKDAWRHASRVWTRCRDFAAAHDALPHDLKD